MVKGAELVELYNQLGPTGRLPDLFKTLSDEGKVTVLRATLSVYAYAPIHELPRNVITVASKLAGPESKRSKGRANEAVRAQQTLASLRNLETQPSPPGLGVE